MEENIFNTETGKKILALAKASFKVSDLISDLVLREKIKSQILIVYKKFIENNHSELLKEIDVLEHYFYLGERLNVVKGEHLKQLQNGFLVFKSHIVLLNNNKDNDIGVIDSRNQLQGFYEDFREKELSKKQKKILEKFEIKNTLRLAEILELFPDVSEKTIRNELASLISLGKITRGGWGNGSFYKKIIDSENQ